jgi:hypothetical protein
MSLKYQVYLSNDKFLARKFLMIASEGMAALEL